MWGKARSRARNWATTGIHRTGTSIRQILLGAFTASFSYWLAGVLWGHAMPFFAAITAFLIIGFTLETKVRKSLELSFGILTGITLGEIAHVTIGPGAWQLFITLMIAVTLARFANSGIVFTIQVAIQSMIVLLMPVTPGMTPGGRALDALTGIVMGLAVHVAFASDPRRAQRRAADEFFGELTTTFSALARSAREGDSQRARHALTQLRKASQNHTDDWALANDAANELTSISPRAHRHADQVRRIQHLLVGSDRAMRNARVIARREVEFLRVTDGYTYPKLAEALDSVVDAISEIRVSVDHDTDFTGARRKLRVFTSYLTPETLLTSGDGEPVGRLGHFEGISLVTELRALAIDLLEATGLAGADARRFLPSLVVITDSNTVGPRPLTQELKAAEPPTTTAALELLITDRTDPTRRMGQ